MNSYTLTSKKIKRNIFFTFILVIITFIFVDLCLYLYSDLKTTKTTFIEEKSSKIKHFNLNKEENRDYVFIGSSRTIYHISTEAFRKNNLNIYNFGVSGNFLLDYPSFINEAIKQKPKNIVISLPVNILFEKIKETKNPFIDDIYLYEELKEKKLFYNSIYYWVRNLHQFLNYSETIVMKIKFLYDRFETETTLGSSIKNTTLLKNHITVDCNVFGIQKINENKIIKKCSNGDGILFGNNIETSNLNYKNIELKNLNHDALELIIKYIELIKNNGINPIVIFEPILNNPYNYSIQEISKLFKFIDLTNFKIENRYWVDSGHLNVNGRKIYSEYLSKYLRRENK